MDSCLLLIYLVCRGGQIVTLDVLYDLLTSCCVKQTELDKARVIVSQDEIVFSIEKKKVSTYLGPWMFRNCMYQQWFFRIISLIGAADLAI